jgi:energy-coupling factor transport system ATP-binding protein
LFLVHQSGEWRAVSAIIKLQNVTFDYPSGDVKQIRALESLSLTIEEGEYIALIGPNGSGKSTLARHLNAILLPTAGEVRVDGFLTTREEHRWEIRRRVGMVFQNPDNQIVATTVEEDVAFGLENLGVETPVIARRVAEALEMVGLQSLRNHAPHLLSGGQKQRLAIAGVIAMRPRCLVLDEPTAMLDPRGRREVLETVMKMNRQEGITVVHITHFMEEILEADRVIVMDRGKIVHQGTPAEIFSGELDLYSLGLEVPIIPKLIQMLRSGGLNIPAGVLNVDELVNFLC